MADEVKGGGEEEVSEWQTGADDTHERLDETAAMSVENGESLFEQQSRDDAAAVALEFQNTHMDSERSDSAPPPGSSLETVLQWRERKGRDAVAAGTATRARTADPYSPSGPGRRSWLAETPLSTKPNPPGHKWGSASRSGAKHLQKGDDRTGVSSSGLGWEQVDQWNALRPRALSPFMGSEPRGSGFARARKADLDNPGCAAYNLQYIPANADSRRSATPLISFSKGRRADVWLTRNRKSGRVNATYGRPDLTGDLGQPYSSLDKQVLARLPSNSGVMFSKGRRKGPGERNDTPGPGEYEVRLKVGDRTDHLLRTRMRQEPVHEFPKQKRPWQRDKDYKKDKPFSHMKLRMYEDGELLSHHRSEPHVRFARAPRHGLKDPAGGGAGTAASGPGPGAYWV